MDENIKSDALLTVAESFFNRGNAIQYDELSMDRICRITPRRELYSPPEKATSRHILFLDCSSFVFSAFYQAFGYEFAADVTKDMINLSNIRVFYYEITGSETEEQQISVMRDFKDNLQTGDVIVTVYNYDNGHTMLYAGNDMLYHCTSNGKKGSYNYKQRNDNIYDTGAIFYVNSSVLFTPEINGVPSRNYLFSGKNRKFCILRPFSAIDTITSETRKRIKGLKNIYAAVTCSHPEGRSVRAGEKVEYKIEISNLDICPRNIDIKYNKKESSVLLNAGENLSKSYIEIFKEDMVHKGNIIKPNITLNDVSIYVPEIVYDKNQFSDDFLFLKPEEIINCLFEKQTKSEGEVYHLKSKSRIKSILVPSLFGGFGVISPEIVKLPEIRTHRISLSSLQSGDLILYKDTLDSPAKAVKYCGNGAFDFAENEDAYDFTDSLFGRFCFCVIRYPLAIFHFSNLNANK